MFIEKARLFFPKLQRSDIWHISLLRSLETSFIHSYKHQALLEPRADEGKCKNRWQL
jgi:hypothetical protein